VTCVHFTERPSAKLQIYRRSLSLLSV